ncbi:hypothetical protein DID77_04010 [Candidatus Marinamargulisbacteria bacterium SCGC AG-439-L15]|nr:hypothetical protein DID77_04010 [Candidatus Marinamargulisbacteria bacterium SCGC AG-439-L15]
MKRWIPWVGLAIMGAYVISGCFFTQTNTSTFGQLPVLNNGRLKPLESVARESLLVIHGKQTLKTEKQKISAIDWLLHSIATPEKSDEMPLFFIHHPGIKQFLGVKDESIKMRSFTELTPYFDQIVTQTETIQNIEAPLRSPFQRELLGLYKRIDLYHKLKNSFFIEGTQNYQGDLNYLAHIAKETLPLISKNMKMANLSKNQQQKLSALNLFIQQSEYLKEASVIWPIPPEKEVTDASKWRSTGVALLAPVKKEPFPSVLTAYAKAFDSFKLGQPILFEKNVRTLKTSMYQHSPSVMRKMNFEYYFTQISPFYRSMLLYVVCFILLCFSWVIWQGPLSKLAYHGLVLTFSVHTLGLVARMIIQERPPVTNLYASAVFVGWAAVGLALLLEKLYKNRVGSLTAALTGFSSLIVAHHLAVGDTLEMMQAVLDSNFWLSTHVVTITIGYSATFLAGFIGIVYCMRSIFVSKAIPAQEDKDLSKMVYGIIAFALIFSFIGTVLGGIWADQSWGRFWGWDPKENGALMIVLWNAMILHARLAGLIRIKGLMQMAIFGNIITSFSWFGVNMLGVGLHSYGFMDKAFIWLMLFTFSQLLIMFLTLFIDIKRNNL